MASDTQQEVFIPLAGAAPGQGGLLVGINPGAVAFVYGAWDKSIKQNVLRLHMCSGKTVQIEDEDTIEHVLGTSASPAPSGSSGSRTWNQRIRSMRPRNQEKGGRGL